MTSRKLIAATAAILASTAAHAALTVQTSNFIATPTNYNGFEALPSTGGCFCTSFEDSISAVIVGYAGINTNAPAEGLRGWTSTGTGYTKLGFGGIINAIEFQATTNYHPRYAGSLQYQVLLGGVLVGAGQIPGMGTISAGPNNGYRYFGFSGARFDEVRLQAQPIGATAFDPDAFGALTLDAINFNGYAAIPEPASWALLIAGFGLVGTSLRRRRVAAA